jgi:hypothetical protein
MKPANINSRDWLLSNFMFFIEHFVGLKFSQWLFKGMRARMISRIKDSQGIQQRGRTIPLADYEYESFEDFRERNPLFYTSLAVFRGAAKDWTCSKKWNKEFFKTQYGSTEITMIDNKGLVDKDADQEFKKTTFKDYFDEAETDKSKYLRFSRIMDHNPELLDDLNLDWITQFSGGKLAGGTYMFIGEGGTKTPMHAGMAHNVFMQIKGDKKWTIYAPNERIFLDVKAERFPYFSTDANPNQLDDPNHPLLKYAQKYEIILGEGDVMWLPSFYFHYVENLTSNMAASYRFAKSIESFKITKMMTTLCFLQTKPPLFVYFFYNMFKKQEYQFSKKTLK